ncbi:MAG: methylmalonyl-CoA epimerase [Phycisphaerales bacterium]|nr:MAG: methylmalonyl-CoA epimerase [Phycisphaerales bacterium]
MQPVQAIDHIGIAVRSIESARLLYERTLGATFEGTEVVPDQKVNAAFFTVGGVRIELLEPTGPDSPVAAYIEKRGEGIHHIAYAVAGLEERIKELAKEGVRLIDEVPRGGTHGTRIVFLHPKSTHGVLTELCEPQ